MPIRPACCPTCKRFNGLSPQASGNRPLAWTVRLLRVWYALCHVHYIRFNQRLLWTTIAAAAFCFFGSLASLPTAYADSIALVEVEGKRAKLFQKQIKNVLSKHDYEVIVVAERSDASDVQASIVARVSLSKRKWNIEIEIWNGAQGEMRFETSFQARKPAALVKILKRKLWKRIGDEVESATPDPDESAEEVEEEVETAPANLPDDTESSAVTKTTSDNPRKWPADINVTFGSQIYSRRFQYEGEMPQPLAAFSAPSVVALQLEAEIFPVQDYGLILAYGFAPSFDSKVSGMTDLVFGTSSRNFRVGGIAKRSIGSWEPRAELEYGGQNFTVKGTLPLPNVRYRFIRIGGGVTREIHPRISVGVKGGYRHLLSAGEIETSAFFPKLTGSAFDASFIVDVRLVSNLYLRLTGSTTTYSSSLNAETGDPMIAETANDRYRALQVSIGYKL